MKTEFKFFREPDPRPVLYWQHDSRVAYPVLEGGYMILDWGSLRPTTLLEDKYIQKHQHATE